MVLSIFYYRAKDGTDEKVFDAPVSSTGQALEWLAPPLAGCSHIPDRGESRRWREYGTMGTIVMSPGESEKKAKTTGSPASWKPIKVRRNTGKTGPGWFRRSEPVPDLIEEGRSPDLSEVPGNHADHQLHRRPGGHPDHPETPPHYPWDAYLQS